VVSTATSASPYRASVLAGGLGTALDLSGELDAGAEVSSVVSEQAKEPSTRSAAIKSQVFLLRMVPPLR